MACTLEAVISMRFNGGSSSSIVPAKNSDMKLIRTIYTSFSLALLFSLLAPAAWAQQHTDLQPTEIVRMAVDKTLGKTVTTHITMKVVRPRWTNEIRFRIWTDDYVKALVLITYPAKEKGQAYLRRNNDLWNWLPNIQKTIKLSASLMDQPWMGSDFTNEDLLNKSSFLSDYEHSIISTEEIQGLPCYKLLLLPKPEAPVVWKMVHLWISMEGFDQLKAAFFGEQGKLVRTMTADEIKNFGKVSLPSRIVMEPAAQPDHRTIIYINEFQTNTPIDDALFSLQNMKNLK